MEGRGSSHVGGRCEEGYGRVWGGEACLLSLFHQESVEPTAASSPTSLAREFTASAANENEKLWGRWRGGEGMGGNGRKDMTDRREGAKCGAELRDGGVEGVEWKEGWWGGVRA